MIIHVALYAFRPDVSEEQIAASMRELEAASRQTELASWLLSGQHIPLPADSAAGDQVYDFAMLWSFADQQALDDFSRHPAITQCITQTVRPVLDRLAIANLRDTGEVRWQVATAEERVYVS